MLKKICYRSHRVSYFITYGRFPQELRVCHTCDNPSCVKPEHLFLGTAKDNFEDMAAKGRRRTKFQDIKIPEHLYGTMSDSKLGRLYNVKWYMVMDRRHRLGISPHIKKLNARQYPTIL